MTACTAKLWPFREDTHAANPHYTSDNCPSSPLVQACRPHHSSRHPNHQCHIQQCTKLLQYVKRRSCSLMGMQNPGPVWESRMPWPLNKPPISSLFFYQGKYTNPEIIQAELKAHSIFPSCSSAHPEASLLKIALVVVKRKSGKGTSSAAKNATMAPGWGNQSISIWKCAPRPTRWCSEAWWASVRVSFLSFCYYFLIHKDSCFCIWICAIIHRN